MTQPPQGPDQHGDPATSGTAEPDGTAPLPGYWERRFGAPDQAPADQAPGGQAPLGQALTGSDQYPTDQYQPGQYPAAQYPTGQYPTDQYPGGQDSPGQFGQQPPTAPGSYQPGQYPPGYQPAGQYQPGYQGGDQAPYPAPPGSDIYLANPYSTPPPRKSGPGRKLIAGGSVLAVLAAGAVAAYAYTTLASSGIQPERVLPANTVAFAKLDLDPAAGQKIAAYRLSSKFPKVAKGAGNADEEKNAILSSFFDDQSDLDYAFDVKPWLGDRIAIAAVPDRSSAAGLDPVLAVAYTDEAKMKAAMAKVARTSSDFGYATVDDYVLISDSQPHAEAVLAGVRQGTLAKSDRFRSDVKSLHSDQIALGWADLGAAVAALKAGTGASANARVEDLRKLDGLASSGRMVIGAHASSDFLEVSAVTHGTTTGKHAASTPVDGTLAKLSAADTSAALEVTGLGAAFSQAWGNASTALGLGSELQDFLDQTGLKLPEDLTALFGTDITASMRLPGGSADPQFAAQVKTDQAAHALQLLDSLARPFGLPPDELHARSTSGGYLISTSADYDPRAASGARKLGDDPAFQKAVPNRANAGLIGYANLGRILDEDPETSAQDKADWKHLGSLGMSVVPTSDGGRVTIRLTTR
ncbi:MAG: DUF3352 domain-containing protein [Actinobacteria bacterium]|nr:DUF3352 domain-containing protein [Actinomycetota bacterium]